MKRNSSPELAAEAETLAAQQSGCGQAQAAQKGIRAGFGDSAGGNQEVGPEDGRIMEGIVEYRVAVAQRVSARYAADPGIVGIVGDVVHQVVVDIGIEGADAVGTSGRESHGRDERIAELVDQWSGGACG